MITIKVMCYLIEFSFIDIHFSWWEIGLVINNRDAKRFITKYI